MIVDVRCSGVVTVVWPLAMLCRFLFQVLYMCIQVTIGMRVLIFRIELKLKFIPCHVMMSH